MKISHVIRGEDHISNTPKQIALIEALDFHIPRYAHIPLTLAPDRTKLSKRHGATAIADYRAMGYLPEALLNFMAFLGWNPKTDQEIFSKGELIKNFSLDSMSKAAAIFNIEKLNWLNGNYIRRKDISELTGLCLPYLENAGLIGRTGESDWKIIETSESIGFDQLKKIVFLEQERLVKLGDLPGLVSFFFKKELIYGGELLVWKKMSSEEASKNLELLRNFLDKITDADFTKEYLEKAIKQMIADEKIGVGEVLWPFRVALTGLKASPPPFEIAEILDKEKTLTRLNRAISLLK
jgi:glutamyl/glutaminyl-tRNA synthetase